MSKSVVIRPSKDQWFHGSAKTRWTTFDISRLSVVQYYSISLQEDHAVIVLILLLSVDKAHLLQ